MTTETKPATTGLWQLVSEVSYQGVPLQFDDCMAEAWSGGDCPHYIIAPPIVRESVRWRSKRMTVHRWPNWLRFALDRAKREAAE